MSCNGAIWCSRKAGQVSPLRYETKPEGHVMKREIEWRANEPVISKNVREEDVIAALISVIILCNMVLVNSAVIRLPELW